MPIISGGDSSGGSSSFPLNWCKFTLTQASPITVGSSYYDFVEADVAIIVQSGSDFSVGTDPNFSDGAIISAAGGVFQACILASGNDGTITLDGGSTATRYVSYGLSMGPTDGSPITQLTNIGIDLVLPVLSADKSANADVASISTPGFIQPGGSVFAGAFLQLANGVGTDSLDMGPIACALWQIGTLAT